MIGIKEILERIKVIEGAKSDYALAKAIGVKPDYISKWRKRGTIPYPYLFTYCEYRDLSLNWLITGEGAIYKAEKSEGELVNKIKELENENTQLKKELKKIDEILDCDRKRRRRSDRDDIPGVESA